MSNLGKSVLAALRASRLKTRLELDPSHSQRKVFVAETSLPMSPTEAEWEAALKQVEIEKANRPQIDWSSDRLKHEWGDGLESIDWTDTDTHPLPGLTRMKRVHLDGYGGLLQRIELPKCQHGVYLTIDPNKVLDYEDNVIEFKSPYCLCCWPMTRLYSSYEEARKHYELLPIRGMERGKLLDRVAYQEIFTQRRQTKQGKYTDDDRLQEDPETGLPRLETKGGYVAKGLGYGTAGPGHGPDSESENIRMVWLEDLSPPSLEEVFSESTEDQGDVDVCLIKTPLRMPRVATLPLVCHPYVFPRMDGSPIPRQTPLGIMPRFPDWYPDILLNTFRGWRGITKENWFPYSWPVWRGGAIVSHEVKGGPPANTNPISGFGSHLSPMEPSSFGGAKEHKTVVLENDTPGDFTDEDLKNWQTPLDWVLRNGRWQARLDLFRGPYDSERRKGHWDRRFDLQSGIGMPTERHLAQWRQDAENRRGCPVTVLQARKSHVTSTALAGVEQRNRFIHLFPVELLADGGKEYSDKYVVDLDLTKRRRTDRWTNADIEQERWGRGEPVGGIDNWRKEEQRVRVYAEFKRLGKVLPAKGGARPGTSVTGQEWVRKIEGWVLVKKAYVQETIAAKIGMYRKGAVNKSEPELPHGLDTYTVMTPIPEYDIPATVAQRMGDGTTREIKVAEMCAIASENYRKARLALATNHGKVGFWGTDRFKRLEGNDRGTALDRNGCAWGGKAPKTVAGNYEHRLEDGSWPDIEEKEATGLATFTAAPAAYTRYNQKNLCRNHECSFVHDHSETCDEVKERLKVLRPLPPQSVVYSRCVQASGVPE